MKDLQLEVAHLTRVRDDLFETIKRKESKSFPELVEALCEVATLSKQISEKEALIESLRPLAQWEKDLLGI